MPSPDATHTRPPHLAARDLLALVALALLALAFFWKLAFTGLILPRGDVFTYFYPTWHYRDLVMRGGQLPLWNPYLFMGAPFLANSQAGVFYPPNWPLVWLDAPTAVKVAIISHAAWAAVGMAVFARRALRASVTGALVAGLVFAYSGYLLAQIEHVNQLQGLAWLPWLFWLWDAATRGQRKALLAMALAFGMQLLAGHSQTTFISGVGLGIFALWRTLVLWRTARAEGKATAARTLARLAWPVGAVTLSALLAAGLAAVQLLPTAELTRFSNRSGGLPYLEAMSFSLRPNILARALLPGYSGQPLFSEYIGYVGIAALVLALAGIWARRRDWQAAGLGLLAGLGVFLALGGFNPVYWVLVRVVPGFDLFRAPARWLVLFAFGTAALAAIGLDALASRAERGKARMRAALWPAPLIIALAGLSFLAPIVPDRIADASAPSGTELAVWAATLAGTLALVWWLLGGSEPAHRWAPAALAALVGVELFVASRELPFNDLSAPQAWTSQRPALSTLLAASAGEVPPARFLSLSDIEFDPGDLREIQAIYGPYLTESGLYDLIVASKQKEILAPNLPLAWGIPSMDGFDGGILPLRDYTRFTGLYLPPGTWSPDGRLREYLEDVPGLVWLRLTNTRWIITDKVADVWIGDVYYDLQFPARRAGSPGEESQAPVEAYPLHPFETTTVGVAGYLEGAGSLPEGTQVGALALFVEGNAHPLVQPLLAGQHLAEGSPDSRAVALIEWPRAVRAERVEIAIAPGFTGTLVVQGVSLIDGRSGAFVPTTLSANHALRLAHSGDVKIYEYREVLPRAYLACAPRVVASDEEAFARLADDPGRPVVVDSQPQPTTCDPARPGQAAITTYAPERVAVQVESEGEGVYLILSDAMYPGWEARLDGQRVEVLRANGLFRAVSVPPGAHEVVFVYRSRSLAIGAAISGICLVGSVAGLAMRRHGRRATG